MAREPLSGVGCAIAPLIGSQQEARLQSREKKYFEIVDLKFVVKAQVGLLYWQRKFAGIFGVSISDVLRVGGIGA